MKKSITMSIILIVCLATLLTGCAKTVTNNTESTPVMESSKPEQSAADTQPPKATEESQEEAMQTDDADAVPYEAVTEQVFTADKKMVGQVIHLEGEDFYTLCLTSSDSDTAYIILEGAYQVLSMEWLNNDRYLCMTSHINPSMNVYTVVDVKDDNALQSYYGLGFTWNADWSNLYHIEPAPHFSDDTTDKLVDSHANILYQTDNGNRLSGTITVTPNDKYIACEVATTEASAELYIFEKDTAGTAVLVGTLTDYEGIPLFTDNETLSIKDDAGASVELKVRELIQ